MKDFPEKRPAWLRDRHRIAIAAAEQAIAAGRNTAHYKLPRVTFYSIPPNSVWPVYYASGFRGRSTDCSWIVVDTKICATKFVPYI